MKYKDYLILPVLIMYLIYASCAYIAKVDGTPVDIIRANTAFMAISLPAGTHSIEMTYVTPHIYSGWTISAIGIILFICYLVFEKKRVIKKS